MKTAPLLSRPTFARLEQRVANQERRINAGVRAGTITEAEAAPLRQKLRQTQANILNDAFDGNGSSRLVEQAKALNGSSRDIRSAAHNDEIDPAQRADNIDARIAKGLEDGSLTAKEADTLKASAAQARAALQAATTPEAKQAAAQQLAALSKQVHTARHNGEMDSTKRTQSFAARIQKGIADGSLTPAEADRLSQRLAGVDAMARNGAADPSLVNRLNRDIFTQRHDAQLDTKATTQGLSQRLDALEANKALSPDQISAFRAQLQQLSADGAKAVGPRLNILRQQLAAAV